MKKKLSVLLFTLILSILPISNSFAEEKDLVNDKPNKDSLNTITNNTILNFKINENITNTVDNSLTEGVLPLISNEILEETTTKVDETTTNTINEATEVKMTDITTIEESISPTINHNIETTTIQDSEYTTTTLNPTTEETTTTIQNSEYTTTTLNQATEETITTIEKYEITSTTTNTKLDGNESKNKVIVFENERNEKLFKTKFNSILSNPLLDVDYSGLTEEQVNFLKIIKIGCINGWNKYGVLPSITAAQAILESGWGQYDMDANNLFGIKGEYNGEYVVIETKEQRKDGSWYTEYAHFRKYPTWAESIEDQGRFLTENGYTKIINEKDYKVAANLLQSYGYATALNYAESLIDIIESFDLFNWDKIAFNNNPTPEIPDDNETPIDNNDSYIIESGDSLWSIANQFGVSIEQLKEWNNLGEDYMLYPGDKIIVKKPTTNPTNPTDPTNPIPSTNEIYTVEPGDSLWWIADHFGVTIDELKEWNNLGEDYMLHPGDKIVVKKPVEIPINPKPEVSETYIVESGDSLWWIANHFGVSIEELKDWNNLGEDYMLHPGDKIIIKK